MKSPSPRVPVPILLATALLAAALSPAAALAGQPKQDVCHLKGNGDFVLVEVAAPAVPAHLAHGDHLPLTFYADGDGDGFGAGPALEGCVVPPGFVENDDDCDDGDPAVNPDATEVCNGVDDDCDGGIDEGLTFDDDGDGFTTPDSCEGSMDDCDDGDPAVNPGAAEACNGVDDDCDGGIDEGLTFDDDGDGFTTPGSCEGSMDDCDDGDAGVNPGEDEVCDDGVDNDCDGDVDGDDGDCEVNTVPVAVDDDFLLSAVECVLPVGSCSASPVPPMTCTLNAPAGTITANDFDAEGHTFDAMIDGDITDAGWTCNGDHLCTTDSGFVGASSSLTVHADGSFDLVYTTTQNFPFGGPTDIVIAEFLYHIQENATPEMLQSTTPARVMIPVHPPVCP